MVFHKKKSKDPPSLLRGNFNKFTGFGAPKPLFGLYIDPYVNIFTPNTLKIRKLGAP